MARTPLDVEVRPMRPEDWERVRAIHREGIDDQLATFETEAPEWADWNGAHRPDCRLVATATGVVVGWAALSPTSSRPVYRGVAEVSIYIARAARRRGIGRLLLKALIRASEDAGTWTLEASVFPENRASVRLHEACGFRRVGVRERIGSDQGGWRDTLLMERRSSQVG